MRVDKWLFFTRFYKTRTLAASAVTGGHVRINGLRARPASNIKAGDQLDIVRDRLKWSIAVTAIPARRGPAVEARQCYVETEESQREREQTQQTLKADRRLMPRTAGRPDKHTQRKLRKRRRET